MEVLTHISLYSFPRATITNYHKLGAAYNSRNIYSHSSGDNRFKIKVSAGLCFSESSSDKSSLITSLDSAGLGIFDLLWFVAPYLSSLLPVHGLLLWVSSVSSYISLSLCKDTGHWI